MQRVNGPGRKANLKGSSKTTRASSACNCSNCGTELYNDGQFFFLVPARPHGDAKSPAWPACQVAFGGKHLFLERVRYHLFQHLGPPVECSQWMQLRVVLMAMLLRRSLPSKRKNSRASSCRWSRQGPCVCHPHSLRCDVEPPADPS